MCLIALAWKCHPRWRLLLAGNRDEFHHRPTAPLHRWPDAPQLIAGRDLRSGGGWLGVAGNGRMAAVTNVRDPNARQTGPSRGALVAGYLQSSQSAARFAEQQQATAQTYPPFNLLVADDRDCHHLGNHPASHQPLRPGVHGISNGALDAPWPKTRALTNALEQWLDAGTPALDPLWAALADERRPADAHLPATGVSLEWERLLAAAFIRGADYGTRASTILGIGHNGQGFIIERRFGPYGVLLGQTHMTLSPA